MTVLPFILFLIAILASTLLVSFRLGQLSILSKTAKSMQTIKEVLQTDAYVPGLCKTGDL